MRDRHNPARHARVCFRRVNNFRIFFFFFLLLSFPPVACIHVQHDIIILRRFFPENIINNQKRSRTRFSRRRHGTDAQRKLGTDAGKLLARRAVVVVVAAAASVMPRSVAVVGGGGPEESAPAPVVRQLSATYKRVRIVFRSWYLFIYLFCRQSVFWHVTRQ